MRLHYFQHVDFETPGIITKWAGNEGFKVTGTEFFNGDKVPRVGGIDWLVIMGGPMNIYEEDKYPYLAEEKKFIKTAIGQNKTVLGICLGAQLIANALGAKVYPGKYKEIGWFNIRRYAGDTFIARAFPPELAVFHWHGDTFDIPRGATRLAESDACPNQGFYVDGGRVTALQFHLEMEKQGIEHLVERSGGDLTKGPYIQAPREMLAAEDEIKRCNGVMLGILKGLEEKSKINA